MLIDSRPFGAGFFLPLLSINPPRLAKMVRLCYDEDNHSHLIFHSPEVIA